MDELLLPDHDRDLKLARKLGVQPDRNKAPLDASEKPFVDLLLKFKQSIRPLQDQARPDQATSAALWKVIDAATRPAPRIKKTPARIFHLRPLVYRIAIAASLLVAAAIGWYLTQSLPEPVLVASADQNIQTYSLPDGTEVRLRPHSKLYSVSQTNQQVVYRLEGEAFFDVTSNPDRTFSVEAGDALVSVLGTEFDVSTWGDAVAVYLQEGRVELKHQLSGQTVTLQPGQSGSVARGIAEIQAQSANASEYLDWLENRIDFTSSPLSTVVEELEFHFAINIEIPEERAGETLTGPIFLEEVSIVLDQLSFIMGNGRFVQIDETNYRFEAN